MVEATSRIAEITLDERTVVRRNAEIEHERSAAIADLLHANHFAPASGLAGPYRLRLATEEGRLAMDIRTLCGAASETIVLSLGPFRRIIKDYCLVCESYMKAIRGG